MEPIFQADFDDSACGYRPKRTAQIVLREVHTQLLRGYTHVVDADLACAGFDSHGVTVYLQH
jgi:RNA-directed DNA polymerase